MDLAELYKMKGELITTLEVAQAKLQEVNNQIVENLNKQVKLSEVKVG